MAVKEYISRIMWTQSKLVVRVHWLCIGAFVGRRNIIRKNCPSHRIPYVFMRAPTKRPGKQRELIGALQPEVFEMDGSMIGEEVSDRATIRKPGCRRDPLIQSQTLRWHEF